MRSSTLRRDSESFYFRSSTSKCFLLLRAKLSRAVLKSQFLDISLALLFFLLAEKHLNAAEGGARHTFGYGFVQKLHGWFKMARFRRVKSPFLAGESWGKKMARLDFAKNIIEIDGLEK